MRYLSLILILVATGCSTPRFYGEGEYADAGYPSLNDLDPSEHNMTEGLNEYDARALSDGVLSGLAQRCGERERMRLSMVARFDNQTTEMLDVAMLSRELTDRMQTGGYKMVDKSSRPDLHDEFTWVESGYVRPDTAPQKGRVEPVRNLVRVVVSSRSQEDGRTKYTRYRMSAQVVDSENGTILCVGENELRKKYGKVDRSL
jgi:hypothetical protein